MPRHHQRPALLLAVSELHPETECAHELLRSGQYRTAVREASEQFLVRLKGLAEQSQQPHVQNQEGSRLISRMFAGRASTLGPVLAFNPLNTRADEDEHDGYRLLALGLAQGLHHVYTHDPQRRELDPHEALEWLAFISAMHRRLDRAVQIPSGGDHPERDTAL